MEKHWGKLLACWGKLDWKNTKSGLKNGDRLKCTSVKTQCLYKTTNNKVYLHNNTSNIPSRPLKFINLMTIQHEWSLVGLPSVIKVTEDQKQTPQTRDNRNLGSNSQTISSTSWTGGSQGRRNCSDCCRSHGWCKCGERGLGGAGRNWFGDFHGNEDIRGTVLTQVLSSFLLIVLPADPSLCCCSCSCRSMLQGPVPRPIPGVKGRPWSQCNLGRSQSRVQMYLRLPLGYLNIWKISDQLSQRS